MDGKACVFDVVVSFYTKITWNTMTILEMYMIIEIHVHVTCIPLFTELNARKLSNVHTRETNRRTDRQTDGHGESIAILQQNCFAIQKRVSIPLFSSFLVSRLSQLSDITAK